MKRREWEAERMLNTEVLLDAKDKNPAAVAMGKLKSPRKAESSRQNGKKGGRPKKEANGDTQ